MTGVKSFICKECDKQFSQLWSVSKHIASVHEGVGYPCNQCDYKANQKDHIKRHVESVHQRTLFGCDKCDKFL